MERHLFFIVVLYGTSFAGTAYCMESLVPRTDCMVVVPNDLFLHKMRRKLNGATPETVKKIAPDIRVAKTEKSGEPKGVCFYVAFKRALRQPKKKLQSLEMRGCEDWIICGALEHYFKRISHPQTECLVVYLKNDGSTVRHCGVMNDDNTIRSKWGINRVIYDHSLWHVPAMYGSIVVFFSLKERFKSDIGNGLLFDDLKRRIDQSLEIKEGIVAARRIFLSLACGEDNKEFTSKNAKYCVDNVAKACVLLKMCTHIGVDTRDKESNTALMLAAQRGDIEFVRLCITHKACKDLTNNDNKTACMLAHESNHHHVVDYFRSLSDVIQDLQHLKINLINEG